MGTDGNITVKSLIRKNPSTSLFARPSKILNHHFIDDSGVFELKRSSNWQSHDVSEVHSRSPDLNESLNHSKFGRASEVSETESNNDYGGARRNSPFKTAQQMKQNSRLWKFKNSSNATFAVMPQLNARRLSISQFFIDSSVRSRLPYYTSYKPSIFGGKRKGLNSNNDSMDLNSPQNFIPIQ